MIVKFDKDSILNIASNLSIKDYLVVVLIKWIMFALSMNLMFDKFMLVWLDRNFANLLRIYFTKTILVSPSLRFMLQLLFAVIDQPVLTIQIYSNLFYSLLLSTETTFCLLLVFRCGIFHGVIIFRQQMRWKFLMVSRGNYLQLFSELFQSSPWSIGPRCEVTRIILRIFFFWVEIKTI